MSANAIVAPVTSAGNAADKAIAYALAQVGKPYGWGATGPDAFDCSGLVMMAYRSAGINLPRISQLQLLQGSPVSLQDLAPGDLCFPDSGHVQIYLGQNSIVEAPSTGQLVRVTAIWGTNYPTWLARRVTDPGQVSGGVVIPTASGSTATEAVSLNPFSDLSKLWNALWGAIKWPANPANWLRVAEFIGGVILIGFALKSFGVSVPLPHSPDSSLTQSMKGSLSKAGNAETSIPTETELPEMSIPVE